MNSIVKPWEVVTSGNPSSMVILRQVILDESVAGGSPKSMALIERSRFRLTYKVNWSGKFAKS